MTRPSIRSDFYKCATTVGPLGFRLRRKHSAALPLSEVVSIFHRCASYSWRLCPSAGRVLLGGRTRVSARGNSSGSMDPANTGARPRGAPSSWGTANHPAATSVRPGSTGKNKIKTPNSSTQLQSAARHVSGFLQVVPIETASARVLLGYREVRVRGSSDRARADREGHIDKSLDTKEVLAVRLRKLAIDGEKMIPSARPRQGAAPHARSPEAVPRSRSATRRPSPGRELV